MITVPITSIILATTIVVASSLLIIALWVAMMKFMFKYIKEQYWVIGMMAMFIIVAVLIISLILFAAPELAKIGILP